MDLIATLTQQLGVGSAQAEGLAGGVLGFIKGQVAERMGAAEAEQLQGQIPELSQWADKAKALTGNAEAQGGLMGALGGLTGGSSEVAALTNLVSGAGLNAGSLSKLVPPVLEFLKARLDPNQLEKVLSAVPGLKGLAGADGGGLMGAIGGFLNKS